MTQQQSVCGAPRVFLVVALLISIASCDGITAEEEPEFARVDFRLRRVDGQAFISSAAAEARPSFSDPASIVFDTLQVLRGNNYEGFVRFFDQDGKDITAEVSTQKENRQIFYTLQGTEGVSISVVDEEREYGRNEFGESLPVGLRFILFVPLDSRESRGAMRFQLVEFPSQVKNGVDARGGMTTVDFDLPIVVDPLPGPQPLDLITRAVLTMDPSDGSGTRTATIFNPNGLHLGAIEIDTLRLQMATRYDGRIQLFNDQTGEELTEQIQADAAFYQFFYGVFSFGTLIMDMDENGFPFGQTFTYDLGRTSGFNTGFVRLEQYDPNFGAEKVFSGSGQLLIDVQLMQVVE